jgi:copper chaperone CopZ
VKIAIDGLTCTLCAAGLERSLRRIDDVSSVEISVPDETAVVRLKSGDGFNPDVFRTAVKSAGQQVRALDVRFSAAVRAENGRYTLQPGGGVALVAEPQSAQRLKPFVGRIVRARARVRSSQQGRLELELTEVVAR